MNNAVVLAHKKGGTKNHTTTQQLQYRKRTMAMFLEEPATVLTTPNFLEKRHG